MLAITISLLLVSAAYQFFISTHTTIEKIQALRDIRHNAIRITHMLEQDLKLAGFHGCRQQLHQVDGTESEMTLHYMAYPAAMLLHATQDEMTVDHVFSFKKNQIAMIADCVHQEIFTISQISKRQDGQVTIHSATKLHHDYEPGAEVAPYVQRHYPAIIADKVTNMQMHYDWDADHIQLNGVGIDMQLSHQPLHIYVAL